MVGTFQLTLVTKCCKEKNMLPLEKKWNSHWDEKLRRVKVDTDQIYGKSKADLQQNSAWIPLMQKVVAAMQWQRALQFRGKEECLQMQDLGLLSIICDLVIWNLSEPVRRCKRKYCSVFFSQLIQICLVLHGSWKKSFTTMSIHLLVM